MSTQADKAEDLFRQGFACSQAVLAAFCERYGMEKNLALKIACGFGGGVQRAEICGAVTGAVLVIGLRYGHCDASDKNAKKICGEKTKEFLHAFRQRNTHICCRDILECDISTPAGREQAVTRNYFTTTCVDMVRSAAAILEEAEY